MLSRLQALVLACALLPGAWFAWTWRAMPHVSEYHDDGLYFVTAHALATGQGYVLESLPGKPAQTKYPPLWPATLSLAWFVEPQFPATLPWTMLLCWIWIPISAVLLVIWLRQLGLPPPAALGIGVFWCLSPYIILFGTVPLSELQFTAIALAALLAMRPGSPRMALLAGLLTGVAILCRTAGIALIPAGLLAYALRREWGHAIRFVGAALPMLAGWVLWSALARTAGTGLMSLYYTNYFGFHLATFSWLETHIYVWKNGDRILNSLGAYLIPQSGASVLERVLRQVMAVAGVVGIVRLWRSGANRDHVPQAVAFWAVSVLLLLFWHFPSSERLILPAVPLWLAGAYTEFRRLAGDIASVARKAKGSQKVAGGLILASLASIALLGGYRQWETLNEILPEFYQAHADRIAKSEPAMQWIRQNLPPDAPILSELDPLLYLRTGRPGAGIFTSTIDWYREDRKARVAAMADAAGYAQRNGLHYFVLNEWDFARDMSVADHQELLRSFRKDPRLETLFESSSTTIYRVPESR